MSTRERPIDRGRRLATADRRRIGEEIRRARVMLGTSQADAGRAAGMSHAQVGRIERGVLASVSVDQLARLGATVGLDVRVHGYPGPAPLADRAQVPLLGRLRSRLAAGLTVRSEVGLPIPGDQRAWDQVITGFDPPARALPVEAETRFIDAQAQTRRIMLKLRDSGLSAVLVVVADTRRNRAALAEARVVLAADFPLSARQILSALAAGRHPGGSGIVLL
jgi:transcriptional regulator with XRE-family HTH domain